MEDVLETHPTSGGSRPASRSRSSPRTSRGACSCKASPCGPLSEADGAETGMFEIPAGGRLRRALELLVKRKRLAKATPVPCAVRETRRRRREQHRRERSARAAPSLDQFRRSWRCAKRASPRKRSQPPFFVAVNVVRQRLRLASVSLKTARRLCRRRRSLSTHGLHRQ
jgi:hypothetical protein